MSTRIESALDEDRPRASRSVALSIPTESGGRWCPIGNDGTPLLTAQYDPSGHRWMRTVWSDGGKGLITLRDAKGKDDGGIR